MLSDANNGGKADMVEKEKLLSSANAEEEDGAMVTGSRVARVLTTFAVKSVFDGKPTKSSFKAGSNISIVVVGSVGRDIGSGGGCVRACVEADVVDSGEDDVDSELVFTFVTVFCNVVTVEAGSERRRLDRPPELL